MNNHEQIAELISRRRRQLIVHSVIYYKMNSNIIDDATWSKWAMELVDLQRSYPDIAAACPYADDFKGFDGSTGFNLALDDPWAIDVATRLLHSTRK